MVRKLTYEGARLLRTCATGAEGHTWLFGRTDASQAAALRRRGLLEYDAETRLWRITDHGREVAARLATTGYLHYIDERGERAC